MNQVAIGTRWAPGHQIHRGTDGVFEEVNCGDKSAAEARLIHNHLLAQELTDMVTGAAGVFLASAGLIVYDAPEVVRAIAEITGLLSAALLVGMLPWAIWGWK